MSSATQMPGYWAQMPDYWAMEFLQLNDVALDFRDRLKKAEAENAKLRELVRAMWLYDYAGKFSSAQDDVEHVAMVYQRMRELGVEI